MFVAGTGIMFNGKDKHEHENCPHNVFVSAIPSRIVSCRERDVMSLIILRISLRSISAVIHVDTLPSSVGYFRYRNISPDVGSYITTNYEDDTSLRTDNHLHHQDTENRQDRTRRTCVSAATNLIKRMRFI
jgi:hypothetical protein